MQYVHKGCLQTWRLTSSNSKSYFRCEQCLYSYNIRRVFLADMLAAPWLPYVFTMLVMVSCSTMCTWVAVRLWGHRFGSRFYWLHAMGAGSTLFGILAFILVALVDAEVAARLKVITVQFKVVLAEARPSAECTILVALQLILMALGGLMMTTRKSYTMALHASRAIISMLGESILNVDEVCVAKRYAQATDCDELQDTIEALCSRNCAGPLCPGINPQ